MKVKLFDKALVKSSIVRLFIIIGIVSSVLSYFDIHWGWRTLTLGVIFVLVVIFHAYSWKLANRLSRIKLMVNNSNLVIEFGDLFEESDKKIIPFNEYFDTTFDHNIISENTLHGKYLKTLDSTETLDEEIEKIDQDKLVEVNTERKYGKKNRYKLGTILERRKYLLLAFSYFDKSNRAHLMMNNYVECLLNMWLEIDKIYNGETVCIPLLGSGITRMIDNKEIIDQELLEIMIWTYRISKVKFTYPSKVKFIIYKDKKDKINLFEILNNNNGSLFERKEEE